MSNKPKCMKSKRLTKEKKYEYGYYESKNECTLPPVGHVKWNIEEFIGYKPFTTFYDDFTIADFFGLDSIKKMYKGIFNRWKKQVKFITELALVLYYKYVEFNERAQFDSKYIPVSEWYRETFINLQEWGYNNYEGEDLMYFYNTLD